jgi:hypothetical protein
MRELIVGNIISLDGYFEGPEKNVMLLPMEGFFDQHNLERLHAADTLLLGATTYAGLKGYWPMDAEHPEVSPAVVADPSVNLHREPAFATTRAGPSGTTSWRPDSWTSCI